MQQNSKYRLWGDRDETIKHIISEWNKLTQKEYKTRHEWRKVIHRELCKKLEFDHTNKWYMLNPGIHPGELDAQTSLRFWDTNGSPNLGKTTRPSDSRQKKRTYWIVDLAVPADHRVKLKESTKRNKYLNLAKEL